jgi:two-component system sensor histidine kinase KdpD
MTVRRDRILRLLRSPIAGWLITVAGIAVTTLVVSRIQSMTRTENVSILYLLVILGSAIAYGTYASIFAAIVSIGVYDYLFVGPSGTVDPGDAEAWLEILLFLIVAIVSSQLAAQQRRRADEARRREQEAMALYTLNSLIVWGDSPATFVTNVFRAFAADLAIDGLALYVPNPLGKLEELAVEGRQIDPPEEFQRAVQVFVSAGDSTFEPGDSGQDERVLRRRPEDENHLPTADDRGRGPIFIPILVENRPVGVLEIIRAPGTADLTETERRFLRVVCQQFGVALDRARLHHEAAEAAALRQSEEVKTAFLNAVTHDLRTPLAMIKASAGSLRQPEAAWTEDERDSFAASIERNVDRLDVIVGNLLDLSRIDAGMVHPERQYYPLATLLDDVLGRLGPLLTNYSVTADVSDDLPPIPIDYVAIDRVVSNLIENVTRHTPAGTRITIKATDQGREVVVSVADDGPGIPLAQLPHLFDRFYRGSATRRDARRGSGLGLAVVRGLVEAHGGIARLDSRVGVGTTVTFTLPVGQRRDITASIEPALVRADP